MADIWKHHIAPPLSLPLPSHHFNVWLMQPVKKDMYLLAETLKEHVLDNLQKMWKMELPKDLGRYLCMI